MQTKQTSKTALSNLEGNGHRNPCDTDPHAGAAKPRGTIVAAALALVLLMSQAVFALEYRLATTLPFTLPAGADVLAVRDMDGDGVLDVVCKEDALRRITVYEQDGDTFTLRFTITEGSRLRYPVVAELDGDDTPEILSTNFSGQTRIFEAAGDNTYVLRHVHTVPRYLEGVACGDSDGDGRAEAIIPQEKFPSQFHILEAAADNLYVAEGILKGQGGNAVATGTRDLDGDGLQETVVADDGYSDWRRSRLYVFENRVEVFRDLDAGILPASLGDTDGNGLGEIIGVDYGQTPSAMRVLESTGVGNGFQTVLEGPLSYSTQVLDVDRDGQHEFWRRIDNGQGQKNVLTFGHREGSVITDFYNTGTLLQDMQADIRGIMLPGDAYEDGCPDLVVVQGQSIRILSQGGDLAVEEGNEDLYCLWPPNRKYVCFSRADFSPVVALACGGTYDWRFAGCASDQPDPSEDDCMVSDDGDAFCVRSERDGEDPEGRRYEVTVVAFDDFGNESEPTRIGYIHVPHDQDETLSCIRP